MIKLLAAVALSAVAAAPISPVTALAGRYSKQFTNSLVDGTKYTSEDVIEIVPVDADHAYFRASLEFSNGHICDISGVAKAVGNTLVYTETPGPADLASTCQLTLSATGKYLRLDDGQASCNQYCGARGTLSDFSFVPLSSKRKISYLPKLKASEEYQSALLDWRAGRSE